MSEEALQEPKGLLFGVDQQRVQMLRPQNSSPQEFFFIFLQLCVLLLKVIDSLDLYPASRHFSPLE